MKTDQVIAVPYHRAAHTAPSTEPGCWSESVGSGTLTVFAIIAPLPLTSNVAADPKERCRE